jgi:putative SOS response-associated peptidase YedK
VWRAAIKSGLATAAALMHPVSRGPDGEITRTLIMATTTANADVATLHDRMPVILEPRGLGAWVAGG